MQKNNVLVTALQKTKLWYIIVRKDRMSNGGGGLAFLIHNSIQYSVAPLPAPTTHDNLMELQAVNIVRFNKCSIVKHIYPTYN